MTSLAASIHAAGLQDEKHSLTSQTSLDSSDLHWVEEVVNCATVLDSYWGSDSSQEVAPPENAFAPPPRFQALTPIGHGGMGVVYSALDTQVDETVAIKVGRAIDGNSDFIKQEFRTLAAIRHPNLVALKELHQFGESVFFTMEYIYGDIFNSQSAAQKVGEHPWKPEQLAELSDQLLQLVNGIDFLHSHGYVHCDIKPTNILITEVGRVVILDLGLARPFLRGQQRRPKCIGGTAAYMSPEQASVESLQPASDWFSFGVVLFETLFGHRPFQGTAVDVLFAKLTSALIPPPTDIGVPEPLSNLCLELLNPDPAARPTGEKIRQCLERYSSQPRIAIGTPAPLPSFFGRQQELAVLDHAWDDSIKGSDPEMIFIEGESGIGKTYLVQKFLENLQGCSETIVLSGRCYENERIPYKAIDAVIGELATQWRLHGDVDSVSQSLINAISAVFKSFPHRSEAGDTSTEIPHTTQTAAAGLHAILQTLSSSGKKIVLFIDDVQWADADSGELLCKMIRGIPLLLICSHRPMETPNPFVVQLEDEIRTSNNAGEVVRRVKIAPFNNRDAALFFDFCFPDLDRHVFGEAIAASAGVPMFLTSLIQQIQEMPDVQVKANNLDWSIGLDPQAKQLLDLVCASGYPLPQSIARKAAQVDKHWEASISALCSRHLITFAQADGEMALTPFHDMIRESVYTKLAGSQRKAIHSTIGTVSESEAGVPPDRLAFHFREAGDLPRFCRYSISAGDVAAKSQAFSGAVRAYSEAFENFIGTDEDKRDLKQKLAFSLGRLGRASESGDLYLELASESDEDLEFLKLSAYQFCVAGRIKDALQGFDRLLRPWGYTTLQSERSVLLRLAWLRFKLRVSDATNWFKNSLPLTQRSVRDTSVAEGAVANVELPKGIDKPTSDRIKLCDLLWDTGIAFTFFDMMKAGLFIHYSQQVALQEGDEVRILRGNMMRANHEAMCGSNKEKLVKKLLDSSNTPVTKRIPYLTGLHLLSSRMAAHSLGQWEMSSEKCAKAEEYFRDNCEKLPLFEGKSIPHLDQMGIGAAQLFGILGLQFSGQYRAMIARYKELLAAPENRENLLNRSNLSMFVGPYVCLAENKPAQAHALLDEAIKMWPADKFCFQHIVAGYVHVEIYLFEGDYQSASETVEKLWKKARWSTHFCFEVIRVLFLEARGRCAIERFDTAQRGAAERIAHRVIRKLEKEKTAWARPMAQKIRAGIELKKQNLEAATIALTAARDGFKQCNMQHYQHPAEAKLCEITGKLETKRFQAVQDWFEQQEIQNRKAYVEMQYPNRRK